MNSNMISIQSLLASTIQERPDGNVIKELFQRYQSISELMLVTEQELITIRGIGPIKARQIISALHLAKSLTFTPKPKTTIRSPKDVADLLMLEIGFEQREHFVVLFLNTKNHVIAKETISIGSLNTAIVHPREVYSAAIKRHSASIVCCHNHPSGDTAPSPEDIQLTNRLVEVGELIGIQLLDHLIIGQNRHYSLKENGYM